ncbi:MULTISPECIES: hypothetical protein [unclassified Sulfitobacter]|uniref:hypothetical protein n=1 Tax=unclassified Sulfitobacter TaxID=196795 RepID=UPI0023E2E334|nr:MULTISPECIES: hypothetical protein [unclassified Sulfitobacter]MDF3383340.1 hypothetical protein [Sulfitobacter sp. Ks11]MDF3386759.1 hypothetical protein [Sulfitobacter sp. M85]MDF3390178.1 hypothetical protein [Sulfitobacter sp. Ks16]MDF3400815.1 hypothetical protein [Sulfitobacter sp. KE39]MDF3404236.1 hypothetical protein [Sulfitobacter sp. Ks35]
MAEQERATFSVVEGGQSQQPGSISGANLHFGGGSGGGGMDKDYLDAKVAEVAAKNDARFAEVLAGIDKVNYNLSAFGDTVRIRLDALDSDVNGAKQAAERAEDATRTVKWNILVTVLSTGLAIAALSYGGFALWNQAIEMTTGILKPTE